ncbi:MAG: hypothetical protein AAF721_00485 [Myxococcota bacterium]
MSESKSGAWVQSPKLTNSLLLAVLTTTGAGAGVGKVAYDGLAESQVEIRIELSRLSDKRDHDDEWRRRHESQPHEPTRTMIQAEADRRRDLERRLREVELAVGALEQSLPRTRRR